MLKNLQKSVVLCLHIEHILEGEADAKFSLMIYVIHFKETPYKTTQAIFAGK